jgi:hypothetical protein
MHRVLLQTFSLPSTLARVGVSRLGTVLGGKVEAPSSAFEIFASLDPELVAPDHLNRRDTADTVEVLEIYTAHSIRYARSVSYILAYSLKYTASIFLT